MPVKMKSPAAFYLPMFLLLAIAASFKAIEPLPAESKEYLRANLASNALKPTERKEAYLTYNFAPLWLNTPNELVVGIIGSNNQRLQIKLLTAVRDSAHRDTYLVTGKSRAKNNTCYFRGTFVIRHIRELLKLSTRVDETISPARHEGILLADYHLVEATTQSTAGIFNGVLLSRWYIDKKGNLRYDDIESFGDGFSNNQFVGTWTSRKDTKTLRCNWGDYRVPNAGDFDIGAGEFSPDAKFISNGWQRYSQAWIYDNAAARKQEKQPWW